MLIGGGTRRPDVYKCVCVYCIVLYCIVLCCVVCVCVLCCIVLCCVVLCCVVLVQPDGKVARVAPCTLNKPTQDLMKLIFDNDMFNNSMKEVCCWREALNKLCCVLMCHFVAVVVVALFSRWKSMWKRCRLANSRKLKCSVDMKC